MNDSTSPPSPASNPQGSPLALLTPAERWAQCMLTRFLDDCRRPGLAASIVGVTQLHVRGEYPDELFQRAGQHLYDCMYNALVVDEATIHFAAATLHAAMAVPPGPAVIGAAVMSATRGAIAAFFNLVRAQAASLPDCTAEGRILLDQQLAAAAPAPTAPPAESSLP